MEITRFTHDDIQYVVGSTVREFGEIKLAHPYFSVTTRSSRKNRKRKPSERLDEHFLKIPIKNPIRFYRKVYSILNEFLKDWDYVSFTAHSDDRAQRERIYKAALEKMGFKLGYIYQCPWDKRYVEYFFAKKEIMMKRKEIRRLIDSAYGRYEWNGEYWEEK